MNKKLENIRDDLVNKIQPLCEDKRLYYGQLEKRKNLQKMFNACYDHLKSVFEIAISKDCCDKEVVQCCDKGGLVTVHKENCEWCLARKKAGLMNE